MTGTDAAAQSASGIAIVDRRLTIAGTPFLVLGGELHNSSSSLRSDLEARWPRITALGVNTVLAAVSWELIEPEEGRFDFSTVDAVIEGARASGLRVVPLWFGSWKNGLSSYRPAWMKRDPERFPLATDADGRPVQVLSAFADENRDADARAFGALMRHIREVDAGTRTVIMVQVENEVGLLGTSRDHTDAALAAYSAPVEATVMAYLREHHDQVKPGIRAALDTADPASALQGDWPATFGESLDTDELFQALAYARYVDHVVAAGRVEYDLPYFVNTWLDSPDFTPEVSSHAPFGGQVPGNYPSGGPLPQVADLWRYAAPDLALLTPDIYWGDFGDWCRLFSVGGGLFIPEMKKDPAGVAAIHVAIGSHGAIGTSPFGIDGSDEQYPPEHKQMLGAAYRALANLSGVILGAQSRQEIVGFWLTDERTEATAEFGGYRLRIRRDMDNGRTASLPDGWGLVATDGAGGFVGTGEGFSVTFESLTEGRTVALEQVVSGHYDAGDWRTTQVLNGDETVSGEFWRFPSSSVVPGVSFGEAFGRSRMLRAIVYEY